MKKIKAFLHHLPALGVIVLFSYLFLNCDAPKNAQKIPPPALKSLAFDYSPPIDSSRKAKQKISFILLAPKYASTYKYDGTDQMDRTFIEHMGSDFAEMLTARGYTYEGPIATYDELVYSQKKNDDMILEVEMNWTVTGMKEAMKASVSRYLNSQPVYAYHYDGDVTLAGRLSLYISEPFTRQKIWVKGIDVTPSTFHLTSYYNYDGRIPESDPLVWNTFADQVDKVYTSLLKTAWNHLDPDEMEGLKTQAKEIKANSGFLKH